jgi:hypothetical protein
MERYRQKQALNPMQHVDFPNILNELNREDPKVSNSIQFWYRYHNKSFIDIMLYTPVTPAPEGGVSDALSASAFKRVYDGPMTYEQRFAFLNILAHIGAIEERVGYHLLSEPFATKGIYIHGSGSTKDRRYNWDNFAPAFSGFTETQLRAIADLTTARVPKTAADIDAMFPFRTDADADNMRAALLNFVNNLALTNVMIDCCFSQRLSSNMHNFMQNISGCDSPAANVFKGLYNGVFGDLFNMAQYDAPIRHFSNAYQGFSTWGILSRYHYLCYNMLLCDAVHLSDAEYAALYAAVNVYPPSPGSTSAAARKRRGRK